MSERIRLYPYRVTYIDAVSNSKSARVKLPIYTDIIKAPNSKEAKKTVIAANSGRVLMFLNSTRHPASWSTPSHRTIKKLTPYQLKVIEAQIGKVEDKPIGIVVKIPTAVDPPVDFKLYPDELSVGGFTVSAKDTTRMSTTTIQDLTEGKPVTFTSTASTFSAVAPNIVPFASQVKEVENESAVPSSDPLPNRRKVVKGDEEYDKYDKYISEHVGREIKPTLRQWFAGLISWFKN